MGGVPDIDLVGAGLKISRPLRPSSVAVGVLAATRVLADRTRLTPGTVGCEARVLIVDDDLDGLIVVGDADTDEGTLRPS